MTWRVRDQLANEKLGVVTRLLETLTDLVATTNALLAHMTTQEETAVATMEELQAKIDEAIAEVQENSDVVASASAVMSSLSQQLSDALASAGTPDEAVAAVQAVIDGLNANTGALAAAIEANTTPEPEPEP
jgi:vacuolar-type H+-ATPase subunit E/Vma4